jgi:hypothetical protein
VLSVTVGGEGLVTTSPLWGWKCFMGKGGI